MGTASQTRYPGAWRVWRPCIGRETPSFERLAAMTARPETNLLLCHCLLAARARWRERVVVYGRVAPEPTSCTAPLAAEPGGTGVRSRPRAWRWAAIMQRAFAIDVLALSALWGPAASHRHAARSRRHPEAARAPGTCPRQPKSGPRSSAAVTGPLAGAVDAWASCLRGESSPAIRAVYGPVHGDGVSA
jgi:hypothetical protein